MNSIRVLLADDHTIVLEGLKAVLRFHEEIEVCGEVEDGMAVINFLRNHPVDVVVLDINMPVMDGLTCARQIRVQYPNLKILILTMYAQKSFIEQVVKIGIHGCLLKNNTGKELRDAIVRVHNGRSYYDLIQNFQSDSQEIANYKLSIRELEIIRLIVDGLNSTQIADKLFISEFTVKTHRKNILRKVGVHNSSQLIQFAMNNKIV